MFKNKRLAYKFSVSILSAVLLIFFSILIYNYYISRKLILNNVQEYTKYLTSSAIDKSEEVFNIIEKITQNASYMISNVNISEEEINTGLSDIVKNNREIFGSCLAFAPYKYKTNLRYYAPYFYKKEGLQHYENLANSSYYYPGWDWYKNPVKTGKPVWSEPYFDKGGGNELMTTYSVPVYNKECKGDSLTGVITTDVSLKWLRKIVSQIKIFNTGYAFLISQKGTFITFPDTNYVMNESIFTLAEKLNDPDIKNIGYEMVAGHEEFVPVNSKLNKGKYWIYYKRLKNNNWSIGCLFPEKELYTDLHKLNQRLIIMAVAGIIILLILIIIISDRITKPLHNLAMVAEGFGAGNFNIKIPENNSIDEVGSLNKSFVYMQSALIKYIENLKYTTSIKEKIEGDLRVARNIQMGMIPRKFPAFPERKEIDIYGFIEPAKEVGGDLYDFFFIDEEHLCFAIGDVSGKGIPAALFMAVTVTIMRSESQITGFNVSRLIELMNNYLCKNNESNLFVTLFLGILNTSTGEVNYVNAGHNYPIIIKSSSTFGEFYITHYLPLGIKINSNMNQNTIKLDYGDTIFLYTDGISEAFNIESKQYSIKRIIEMLGHSANHVPFEIVNRIIDDVRKFSLGAEQSDDISILAIQYFGKQHSNISG
ncbi:MAG: SpoIIE family protein phosphatase [Bacteroidia bacterium]|nr:SpoIIE family protein phosphatase [Bacteroidia bacterium]